MYMRCIASTLAVLAFSSTVFAHPGHENSTFSSGLAHPWAGLDHLIAAAAIGLLAMRFGGPRRWATPLLFVGGLLAGGAICGVAGMRVSQALPTAAWELLSSISICGLGLLVCLDSPPRRIWVGAAVGVGAIQGLVHLQGELQAFQAAHLSGLLLATLAMQLLAVCFSLWIERSSKPLLRWKMTGLSLVALGLLLAL